MLSWNINGLRRKLGEQNILDYLRTFDVIFLNETWISKQDSLNFDINVFCSEHIYGNKTKNTKKGRFSGGITFYFNSNIKQYVKIVEKHNFGIICVKLSANLFDFNTDVYICDVYIPSLD